MEKLKKALDQATERFKELIVQPSKKFVKLPFWLNYVSYLFKKEDQNDLPKNYYHFDRGAVIRVNFGVNPGSEFSFTHFAIVLDKHDNSRKSTLTVLPLTSKKGKNRYSLGKDLFNQTVAILTLQIDNVIREANEFKKNAVSNWSDEEFAKAEKEIDELNHVIATYKDFNKNSYVRINDITTISKLRINRLNKFDPSGKIKLSQKQMKEISLEISKSFLDKL